MINHVNPVQYLLRIDKQQKGSSNDAEQNQGERLIAELDKTEAHSRKIHLPQPSPSTQPSACF